MDTAKAGIHHLPLVIILQVAAVVVLTQLIPLLEQAVMVAGVMEERERTEIQVLLILGVAAVDLIIYSQAATAAPV